MMDEKRNETERPVIRAINGRDEAIYSRLHQAIKAYNNDASEHFRRIRVTGREPLDRVVVNGHGEILGGLMAETYWGWLELDQLWLDEGIRGRGYGRQLVLAAERDARQRGCTRALVSTYSFQARGFYERLGYMVIGQLDDYPPGHTFFWLRKDDF